MKKSLLSMSLVSLTFGLFALGACSSTTTTTTTGDGGSTADGSTSESDASLVKDSSTGKDSSTPPPADKCAAEASNEACQQCCAESNTAAYNAFTTALITCACKDTVCKTQCGTTLCAATPANPTPDCQTCLAGAQNGACQADLQKACTGSGPCAPFAQCVSDSCAGKK